MTKQQKINTLKAACNEDDYKKLLKAVEITEGKAISDGFSISSSRKELRKVENLILHLTSHKDSYIRGTAKNILQRALQNSRKGFFGGGTFVMD
jgi:hypothetical protein|tara:strand:+ start:147 stop:428 length:282 start_codon:yes stop_codon:yes gene_type:complete